MKKFVLICCCEREIETPKFFDTLGEATQAMLDDLAITKGYSKEEIEELINEGNYDDYETGLTPSGFSAWTTVHHDNVDWQIFEVEI